MNLFDLSGKTAFVTGASSGLGWGFAKCLSKAGAKVIIAARRQELRNNLKAEIESEGGKAITLGLDVSRPEQIYQAIEQLSQQGERIDVLVNNAGVAKKTSIFDKVRDDSFEDNIQTNLTGLWHMTKAVANHMKALKIPGSIINISSVNGQNCLSAGSTGYSASKAAVIQLTKALVGELSLHQIRINAIAPGWFHTPMTDKYDPKMMVADNPLGFVGVPGDLDGVLLLLASNQASRYITGVTITVDGGVSWGG